MTERVFIHEYIDIIGHGRAKYMHHMLAHWGPIGQRERNQLCVGVWATVGSTGKWPQVINLWEYENFDALGRNFDVELRGAGLQDPELSKWWSDAASLRSGGHDRILVAANGTPGITELCADVDIDSPAAGYLHEHIFTNPGAGPVVAQQAIDAGATHYNESGFSLVGSYWRAMCNDNEAVLIWAVPRWQTWATAEADHNAPIHTWRRTVAEQVVSWDRVLMADAPLSPLRIGRQPVESDRD